MTLPIETTGQVNVPPSAVKKRIALIVDDGELIRRTASYLLLRLNFDVATASDGYRGIQLAVQLQPDVIFLDLLMPNLDGLQVLQVLKSQEKTKSIPILVITGYGDKDKILNAIKYGATCVVRKPLKESVIFSKLREIFGSEFDGYVGEHHEEQEKSEWDTEEEQTMGDDNDEMMEFLRKQFVILFMPKVKMLPNYIAAQQRREVLRIIHDIKGSAGTVGFGDVTEMAADIEPMLGNEEIQWEIVGEKTKLLDDRMTEIQQEVESDKTA